MAEGIVRVDEAAIASLRNALETAGEDYKSNLARLTNLMEEITSGDIQGDPANDLLSKFQAKQDTLNRITATIEEAEEYMGIKKSSFVDLCSGLKSSMK